MTRDGASVPPPCVGEMRADMEKLGRESRFKGARINAVSRAEKGGGAVVGGLAFLV